MCKLWGEVADSSPHYCSPGIVLPFAFGFFAGGLISALLMGEPSPSSPMSQLIEWLESDVFPPEVEAPANATLHYFNVRGRGEAIRVAFADRRLLLEDRNFTSQEWGKGRPDGLKAKM